MSKNWKTMILAIFFSIIGAGAATSLIFLVVINTGRLTVEWHRDGQRQVVAAQAEPGADAQASAPKKTEKTAAGESAPEKTQAETTGAVITEPELYLFKEKPLYSEGEKTLERVTTRDKVVYSNCIWIERGGYVEYAVNGYEQLSGVAAFSEYSSGLKADEIEVRIIGDRDRELCAPIVMDSDTIRAEINVDVSGNESVRIEYRLLEDNDGYNRILLKDLKLSIAE